jgi:RNA polymerase-binding transcription factor
MEQKQREELRAQLVEMARELDAIRNKSAGARAPVSLDQQSVGRISRMDAMQQQAMAQAQERQRTIDKQRIEQALRRMAVGEYGYCLTCDEEIASKRLAIDPAASLCVNCAGRG